MTLLQTHLAQVGLVAAPKIRRLQEKFLDLVAISQRISPISAAIARLDVNPEVAMGVTNSSTRPVSLSNTRIFSDPSAFVVQEQAKGQKPLSMMWRNSKFEITLAPYT